MLIVLKYIVVCEMVKYVCFMYYYLVTGENEMLCIRSVKEWGNVKDRDRKANQRNKRRN